MTIRNRRRLPAAGAALSCLLLAVCAGQTTTARDWVKGGADDQTIARELADCNAQANAALANEHGINADINATLGRNWQLGGTQTIEAQAMRRQASGYADQVLDNCMRAKGFSYLCHCASGQ
jgi:alkylation response protein AidB-like acyl-CoA dehydrogenase